MTPDILLIGQITVDDTAPALPGIWRRHIGGNALYSVAGARLWCEAERIGMIARVPRDLPLNVFKLLSEAGLSVQGLRKCDEEPLIEWILYEEDGNRQSLPRNPSLRDPAATMQVLYARYLEYISQISASFDDVPQEWLPASAIHLAPQVIERHRQSCVQLAQRTTFLSVDPSPHYSRDLSVSEMHTLLPGVSAFLPSQAEIQHLSMTRDWLEVASDMRFAGFSEVVIKRGSAGCILTDNLHDKVHMIPAAPCEPLDLTGAGDAFSGAYATCRALGFAPHEAAQRATITAAMVIECSGADSALQLNPKEAIDRLHRYRSQMRLTS